MKKCEKCYVFFARQPYGEDNPCTIWFFLHLKINFFFIFSLQILLVNRLDNRNQYSFVAVFSPLYISLLVLIPTSFGQRGGNHCEYKSRVEKKSLIVCNQPTLNWKINKNVLFFPLLLTIILESPESIDLFISNNSDYIPWIPNQDRTLRLLWLFIECKGFSFCHRCFKSGTYLRLLHVYSHSVNCQLWHKCISYDFAINYNWKNHLKICNVLPDHMWSFVTGFGKATSN